MKWSLHEKERTQIQPFRSDDVALLLEFEVDGHPQRYLR